MRLKHFLITVLSITAVASLHAQSDPTRGTRVRQITILSQWGGLGRPSKTELSMINSEGIYRQGGRVIDSSIVDSFTKAIREAPIAKPSALSLGITPAWLDTTSEEILGNAKKREDQDSTYWSVGGGTDAQKRLFKTSYTDQALIDKVLPELFRCCHTDDYPFVKVTVTFSDGKTITITSHSQSVYMLPWTIETNVANTETFNRDISLALGAILPVGSTNRERIVSDYVGIALATVVMNTIEPQWKLMAAEGKAADALIEIRRKYQVIGADVNPNHDVTFGVYSQRHGGVEENLHAIVRRSLFPKNLTEEAILLYKNGKVRGVDEFSNGSSRYEDLVLSVPWLSQLWKQYPRWPITLLWVHDVSLSDKGMRQFSADMHKLRKDALADEVRKVQRDVAVLNVSYGDWWLVLPDKRMVLWRYESVSGLLGFKQSQISAAECTDYQGVTGGCVGAVISPDGQFIQ